MQPLGSIARAAAPRATVWREMAAFGLLVALLAGCIPTDGASEPARTPTPAPGARAGGTLRVAITPPDGIDPGNANEPSGELITRTMCDQLLAYDPVTGEPRPALAESWSVVPGGKAIFVKLRRGLRFSDGREVTADDVAYTFSRVASERYASRAASLLEPISGYAFIHGDVESPNERARRQLLGVSAVDARTVEIRLDEPRADFFRVFAHPALTPVPRRTVEADPIAFTRQPVCSGPYRLADPWEQDEQLVLERVEGYTAPHEVYTRGGAGWADRIEFVIGDDPVAAYARGDADLARDPAARGSDVVQRVGSRIEFIGLPVGVEPFDRRAVRQALSRALDREAIARAASVTRTPAGGFYPPAFGDLASECEPGDTDVDLRDIQTTIAFNDELGNRALVAAVATQWRARGVRVTLRPLPFEAMLQEGQSSRGMQTPFRFGWAPRVPSADELLAPLFTLEAIGSNNLTRFDSRDLSETLRDARKAASDEDRLEAYRRAHDILCAEMPMIPVTLDVETWRARRAMLGSAIDEWLTATDATPILREIYVRS